jgi:hypothetical protein
VIDPAVPAGNADNPFSGYSHSMSPRQDVRLLPPSTASSDFADVRPAGVRSVFSIGGNVSAITAWRPESFGHSPAGLLQLLHPEVAWIFDGPGRSVPANIDSVLRLLLEGKKEKDIARQLGKSEHTIHAHVKRVYRHFGVNSRSQLLVRVYGLEKTE